MFGICPDSPKTTARISAMGKTEMEIREEVTIAADSCYERVILPHVIIFAQILGNNFVLMQNNARSHKAHLTQRALSDTSVLPSLPFYLPPITLQ